MHTKQYFENNKKAEKEMINAWLSWHGQDEDIPNPNPSFMNAWMVQQEKIKELEKSLSHYRQLHPFKVY